jgi:hypothetical protein
MIGDSHNKPFYNQSLLKQNILTELCNDLTGNEALDINVEKVK